MQESHGFSTGGWGGVSKEGLLKHSPCNSVTISTCVVERGLFRQAHPSSRCHSPWERKARDKTVPPLALL